MTPSVLFINKRHPTQQPCDTEVDTKGHYVMIALLQETGGVKPSWPGQAPPTLPVLNQGVRGGGASYQAPAGLWILF